MNAQSLSHRLERALARWSEWRPPGGRPLEGEPKLLESLAGGLSNHSWLVETGAGPVVLRLSADTDQIFAVDRERELLIHRAVADLGLAPPLWWAEPEQGVLVRGFCQGRVWTRQDSEAEVNRQRLLAVLNQVREVQLPLPRFNYWAHLSHYVDGLRGLGIDLPPEVAATLARDGDSFREFQLLPWRPVLVHHDLNSANIIDTGSGLTLIDWEYAAMGHPAMDLQVLGVAPPGPPMPPGLPEVINALWQLLSDNLLKLDILK